MGGKSKAPKPPDYSELARVSEKSAEMSYKIAREQLDWAKSVYAENKDVLKETSEFTLKAMQDQHAAAMKDRARYEEIYQPLEDQLAAEAADYSTQERKDKEIGRAQATVAQNFEGARQAAQRQLESYGVNPSATRFAALDVGMRASQAAAAAAAGNQASENVDATARALRSEAINVGRGYPGQIAGSYAGSVGAGNSAIGNANATAGMGGNLMGTAPQWQGLGNQAVGQWGNILNQGYQNQLQAWQANQSQSSGWGTALGFLGSMATLAFEDGGPVPEGASPSGGVKPDDVSARLTAGEFVIPPDAVKWYGEKHFHHLIEKAEKERQEATALPVPARPAAPALPVR